MIDIFKNLMYILHLAMILAIGGCHFLQFSSLGKQSRA